MPKSNQVNSTFYSEDEKLLLAAADDQYTLQLMASIHLEKLLKENHVILQKRKFPYYLYRYGPKWHVLVYGIYPSEKSAKSAIKTIPASLRKQLKPWVRSLLQIKKEIIRSR